MRKPHRGTAGGRFARWVATNLVAIVLGAMVLSGCSPAAVVGTPTDAVRATRATLGVTARTAATPAPTGGPALIHDHITGLGYGKRSGIAFDYPAGWHVVPYAVASFTNGEDDALIPTCCRLQPNQFAVSITTSQAVPVDLGAFKSPGSDVKPVGDWLVVRETIPTQPSDLVDVHTYWVIGRPGPGETVFSISAIFRGPDLAPMQAQVDAFVDSITLDPEPVPNPS